MYKFIRPILIFYLIAAGCSGTTHSSAEVTLVKIPFGHAEKASKNKTVRTHTDTDYFPQTLGDLNLAKIIYNKKAADIINKMHGKKLDDCENFIAYYGNKKSKNTLYISVYKDNEEAKANLKSMAMKMAELYLPCLY